MHACLGCALTDGGDTAFPARAAARRRWTARSIQRMLVDGLIEELAMALHDESDDDRRRHYRLTRKGLEIAQREARRLAALVDVARQRNLLGKRAPTNRPASARKGRPR
jgi:hypothetical protein